MSSAMANPLGAADGDGSLRLALHAPFALAVLLLFVLQPFGTLVLVVGVALAWRRAPAWFAPLLVAVVAGWLALVNVTKLPESDLMVYFASFDDARAYDLPEFLLLNAREPLYYISLYYFAQLPGADTRLYVFLSTLVPYALFLVAVLRLCRHQGVDSRTSFALALLLAFFPQLFSLSAHLMRQFLASALMMTYLGELACTGRRRWGIGVLAAMCHYSAFLLLGLSLFRKLQARSGLASVGLFGGVVLAAYALAALLAPYLMDVPVLGLIFVRIGDGGQGAQLDPLNAAALGLAALFFVIAFYALLRGEPKGEWTIAFATITVATLVLVSAAQPMLSEIATRYFFYLYFLIGMLLPFTLARVAPARRLVQLLAVLVLPLFFYKIANGDWQFASVQDLLFAPSWTLWTHLA